MNRIFSYLTCLGLQFVPTCLRYNHHIDNLDNRERLIKALISTGEDSKAQI